jgi:two-component system LytT family response regulator
MKAIIIDDERLARAELRKLLQDFPEMEVVDEAANVDEGISKIENHNPDVIFWIYRCLGKQDLIYYQS